MRSHESAISRALRELRQSALGSLADHYAAALAARRLAPATVANYLRATLPFARWLEDRKDQRRPRGSVAGEADVDAFLAFLRGCGPSHRLVRSRTALRHLVSALRNVPGWIEAPRPQRTPVDDEVERFDAYLRDVCGLSVATRLLRTSRVRLLLTDLFADGPVRHGEIRPEALSRFFVARTERCSPGTASGFTDAMRTYVRFLSFHGLCPQGLDDAVPRVPRRRLATVP